MHTADDPPRRSDSESDHELYTIPNYSSWFSWDEIHHNERIAHSEFFNNSSISKTPKIYKEYRDFIINKYREDPSRRLVFTDVRKCLIGDVGAIHKIYRFLERWGLINFGISSPSDVGGDGDQAVEDAGVPRCEVVVEEGSPYGVRVVEFPNSSKALAGPTVEGDGEEGAEGVGGGGGGSGGGGLRLPPLTSYSDVFGEVGRQNWCWNCGGDCVSGYYKSAKRGSLICAKCFENENCGDSKVADDFKFIDADVTGNHGIWTDEETLLLLEAVVKYGDDWNAVAQHVRTKSKLDCISRLIQLPFGEHILGTISVKGDDRNLISHTGNVKLMQDATVENEEPIKTEEQHQEYTSETEQIERGETEDPPPKRQCVNSFADAGSSLMKQVALLSTVVGPHIAAAAADATVATLCDENPCAREIFEAEQDCVTYEFGSPTCNTEPVRVPKVEDVETEEDHKQTETLEAAPQKKGPSTLHIRAAIATAFGAAAAHSKLLADQEDREIEHLMATIIEAQLNKIQSKIKHFEELESIMEKEYAQIQQLKESIFADWIDVLEQAFRVGIPRYRDHGFVKSLTSSLL
ncbi:SWI/SNF complex subunit SWI3A-like isoform X2 [Magnolia sinica]|uniref:SWI/SNF complex subunit SWI3A-like isoform X2 n=1 Tax=Magnolia sinica TaxID=86752 RepID=UPI002659FE7B|nr:SWI/SNF complex subunit SWI3A-like isoform X2 [Magnolia sinica]